MPAIGQTINVGDINRIVRKLNQYGARGQREAQKALEDTTLQVQHKALEMVPADKGDLKRTIRPYIGPMYGEVRAGSDTVDYAAHVEYGTKPHPIEPVKAEYLRFKVNGEWVMAKHVDHPGTMEQPYMRPAANLGKKQFRLNLTKRLRDLSKTL